MRYVKILNTYSLISHPQLQNILFSTTVWPPTKPQNFSTPFLGDLHNPVWPLTSTSIKSQTHSKGNSQNAGLTLTSTSKFSTHSYGNSQNASNFLKFSNINPSHGPTYRSKGIEHSSNKYRQFPNPFWSSNQNPYFKLLCVMTAFTSYSKISFTKMLFTIKFIHKNSNSKPKWKFTLSPVNHLT